ncbi:Protein of unknown function (DUF3054) [Murinocardiopsis flavida]|uniref:DUF3054 family protein n=1 Tax=Murinocardiopsis flavida TaxID=645275 RepID=A0A2P8DJC6_9ACTN|nr:DUF3054 domain-containing protein [Murinocardiopsis flavida]PSK97327.1 Protein of unknown function (DUF3054) [Murinocardiopsis flavida]
MRAPFFALRPGGTAVPTPWAVLFDLACVTVFVAVGRANHHEAGVLLGLLGTAWPFAAALALAWALAGAAALARGPAAPGPARVLANGALIWAVTVAGGLALRVAAGAGGAPLSFAVVTTLFLAVTMLGWRAAALVPAGRAARRGRAAPTS